MARWGQTFFRFCFPVLIPLQEAPTGYCSAAGGCLAVWISAVLPVSFFDGPDIVFRGCGERRGVCTPGAGGPGERPFRGGGEPWHIRASQIDSFPVGKFETRQGRLLRTREISGRSRRSGTTPA